MNNTTKLFNAKQTLWMLQMQRNRGADISAESFSECEKLIKETKKEIKILEEQIENTPTV